MRIGIKRSRWFGLARRPPPRPRRRPACGDDDDDGAAATAATAAPARRHRGVASQRHGDVGRDRHPAPRLLPQRHPRPGDHRRRDRVVRGGARARRRARARHVQLRHRGDRGAVRRRHRRQLHRAQPGDQRLRPVRRRGPAHRRRARPRAAPRSSCARASTTPEDLAGTTLASPSLGNTQDVALRAWLADQGYETDTSGGGDVRDHAAGQRRHARRVPGRRRSTAPGCPSRGRRASSTRAAATCWSTRPTCGPTASSSPPT